MTRETYPKVYLYRRIVQAKLFIDNHYSDNIDLDKIADEALLSKFHFIRLFKKIYRKTPHQYLIAVRIEKARLLFSANTTVTDTCFAIGFESPSSFSGLFKRFVGLSPSTYLAKQRKRQTVISNTPLHFVPGCFAEKKGWTKKSNFEEVSL